METVVAGFDGSDTSRAAVFEAAQLAAGLQAQLHVVNVVDDSALRAGLSVGEHDAAVAAAAKATTEQLASADLANLDGLRPVITHVTSGAAADVLVRYAETVNADLLVVGNRRVQGIQRLLGSVAVEVLRHTPCSVYVAHTV